MRRPPVKVGRKNDSTPHRPDDDARRALPPGRRFDQVMNRLGSPIDAPASPTREPDASARSLDSARQGSAPTHRDAGLWTLKSLEQERPEDELPGAQPIEIPTELQPQRQALAAVDAPPAPVRSELDPVFDRVVQEVVVVEDRHRRRAVRMRLSVRGRSDLDVEVAPTQHGVEVRFSTDDEDLRRELRRRRSELTDRARQRGVALSGVRVG